METGVAYYRLYMMSRTGEHIASVQEIEAVDDLEAIRIAAREAGPQPLELWCRNRKVKRFEPAGGETLGLAD